MNDYSNSVCVFVGRFQPFNLGQLMVVEGMAKSCRRVIVAVGSANKHDERGNPFSFEERREMIQRALQEKDLIPQYNIEIAEVVDIAQDKEWMDHLRDTLGAFDAVWTGNPQTQALCESAGVEVKVVKEVPGINGEGIREMMRNDDGFWDEKVPNAVATYVKSIEGHIRVRNLG